MHNPALSWLQKSVAIAYPLGDVLVLAMLARLLAPGPAAPGRVQLLTLGIVGMLVSDVLFGLIQLYGSFRNGTVVDLGWARPLRGVGRRGAASERCPSSPSR